jgi:hypothetical protein
VVRSIAPEVYIAARTSYLSRAIAAAQEGADHVTVEEIATANDMARQVMDQLGKRGMWTPEAPEPVATPSST